MTASDVRYPRTPLELVHDTLQRGQPGGDQLCVVACAEKPLGTVEKAGMMLAPLHALAAFEIIRRSPERVERRFHDVVCAGQIDGAVRVGQAQGLLRGHRPFAVCRIVLNVAACTLITQPFANVAFVGCRTLRKFSRSDCASREFLVKSQSVADQYQRGAESRAQITDRFAE